MIIEQLALAHFTLGLLSCKAANAGKVEAVGVYAGAAARMMGEFRRSRLALQAYRAASRQLAHDPTKDLVIPHEDADTLDDQSGKRCINDELDATDGGVRCRRDDHPLSRTHLARGPIDPIDGKGPGSAPRGRNDSAPPLWPNVRGSTQPGRELMRGRPDRLDNSRFGHEGPSFANCRPNSPVSSA